MKVVILAGGQKSTISNEQEDIPKPMAEIGGKPILWHIMRGFSAYGFHEFVICGGYRVDLIKQYFMDYYIYQSDITVDLQSNTIEIHKKRTEDWKVTVVDTGLYSSTGQRVSKIREYIKEDSFLLTYGDCLSDISIDELVAYHKAEGKMATMAVARPTGRNVTVAIDERGQVIRNSKAPGHEMAWTSASVYVLNQKVFDILVGNYEVEQLLMDNLADRKQLSAYKHYGFWTPVETYRDRVNMENLWNAGMAPWVNWR
ncbi:glucose-1-phosphate cytidylyltransferase [Lachnospiraceae bacterium]|nr:glucose-1-phosphate cytidylyltransferase [Lachnospiraceae bacterium]